MNEKKFTCPCCGYKTLQNYSTGSFEICPICFWEDDNIQFDNPEYSGGANRISLMEAQKNYINFGASDRDSLPHVREASDKDYYDMNWDPFFIDDTLYKIINLQNINSIVELHQLLKEELNFPDFYGMNWDAFWDSISDLVELPKRLIFNGWNEFNIKFSNDAKIILDCFNELKLEKPSRNFRVIYR